LVEWDPYALTQMDDDNRVHLPIHYAGCQSTIIGFRLVFEAAIRYFPYKKGISLLFKKDYKNNWPLRMACDEHRFGCVKSMEAIEAIMSIYSSTSLKRQIRQHNFNLKYCRCNNIRSN
jgi:hypothetical protein